MLSFKDLLSAPFFQEDKTKYSEQLAEARTDEYMEARGLTRLEHELPGDAQQGQFDRIYTDKKGNVFIVEVKGGDSQLGSRKIASGERAGQCTEEYMDDIIANMEEQVKNMPKGDARDALNASIKKINKAQMSDKLELNYLYANQKAPKIGEKLKALTVMDCLN